jgi:Putative zinc-finger
MRCYDDGALRAYLDDALPHAERAAIAAHLDDCAACRDRLEQQRIFTTHVGALLAAPAAIPDTRSALARLRATIDDRRPATDDRGKGTIYRAPDERIRNMHYASRRIPMRISSSFWTSPRRSLFAGLAAIVVLLSLLALPPVRAAADQLLQIFRVQKVLFVPISPERFEQLKKLNFDGKTLFVATPKQVNQPAPPRIVASADAASSAVGFPARQPTVFPSAPSSTEMVVHDHSVVQFQVNVASARQLLALLNVDDVTLPDSLGTKPITGDAPPYLETRYRGNGYTLTLYQGHSPTVTLPDGVELAQLGRVALRVLGMDPAKADVMSRQIDWSSTLIFPFPKNIRDVRQVQIGDVPGLLINDGSSRNWQLYWQNGDHFSVLEGQGRITDAEIIATAESIR